MSKRSNENADKDLEAAIAYVRGRWKGATDEEIIIDYRSHSSRWSRIVKNYVRGYLAYRIRVIARRLSGIENQDDFAQEALKRLLPQLELGPDSNLQKSGAHINFYIFVSCDIKDAIKAHSRKLEKIPSVGGSVGDPSPVEIAVIDSRPTPEATSDLLDLIINSIPDPRDRQILEMKRDGIINTVAADKAGVSHTKYYELRNKIFQRLQRQPKFVQAFEEWKDDQQEQAGWSTLTPPSRNAWAVDAIEDATGCTSEDGSADIDAQADNAQNEDGPDKKDEETKS